MVKVCVKNTAGLLFFLLAHLQQHMAFQKATASLRPYWMIDCDNMSARVRSGRLREVTPSRKKGRGHFVVLLIAHDVT